MNCCKNRCLVVLLCAWGTMASGQTEPRQASAQPSDSTKITTPAQEKTSDGLQLLSRSKPEKYETGLLLPGADPQNTLGWSFVKHLASDQKTFWTSGKNLDRESLKTFVPFAAFTGLLVTSDSWLAQQVPDKPNQLNRSNHISQYATYCLARAAGGSLLWSHLTQDDRVRETGFLSGEALLNSTAATFALRGITRRERPFEGDGSGKFFQGGSSFP